MVRHPVRTAEGVVHAATHPVQTATAVWAHGKATATACASGDGGACGRGAFELGSLALGGAGTVKAAGKLGKLRRLDSATDAARTAKTGEDLGALAAGGGVRASTISDGLKSKVGDGDSLDLGLRAAGGAPAPPCRRREIARLAAITIRDQK